MRPPSIQIFRQDRPIVDPRTGFPSPEFLRNLNAGFNLVNYLAQLQNATEQNAEDILTKQPLSDLLTAIAALTTSADTMAYFTGPNAAAITPLTAQARALLDDVGAGDQRDTLGLGELAVLDTVDNDNWSGLDLAVANGGTGASSPSAARSNLGLAIGSDVQAHDADLDAIAALATAAFGRSLLTLADAAALRTAAGLNASPTPVSPTLGSGWSAWTASGSIGPQYQKSFDGWVAIEGAIAFGTPGILFTLPAGHRPPGILYFMTYTTNPPETCRIDVHANGDVEIVTDTSGNLVSLSGIGFYAA